MFVCMAKFGSLDMEIILNATLAGGVGMGAAADIIVNPGASMAIGLISGLVSSLGYVYVSPYLADKFNFHDTCGIHNLHAMPGVIGCLASVFVFYDFDRDYGANNA